MQWQSIRRCPCTTILNASSNGRSYYRRDEPNYLPPQPWHQLHVSQLTVTRSRRSVDQRTKLRTIKNQEPLCFHPPEPVPNLPPTQGAAYLIIPAIDRAFSPRNDFEGISRECWLDQSTGTQDILNEDHVESRQYLAPAAAGALDAPAASFAR